MPRTVEVTVATARDNTVARHRSAHRSAPAGPSMRTTVIAGAAAIGAVTTGTFTALIPSSDDGLASKAAADESPLVAHLAANVSGPAKGPAKEVSAALFSPVDFADDAEDAGAGDTSGQPLALLGKAADIAASLAKQHAAEAEKLRLDQLVSQGGVDGWIAEALRIMDLPQSLAPSVKKIIMAESGGNPHAINNWDANARRGTPSQGLMQTIPVTFRKYVHPSLAGRPITDPVANITAGVRYMIDTYGVSTLQAGGRSNSSGGYVGY